VENKKCLSKAYILPAYVLKIKGFLSKMEEREKTNKRNEGVWPDWTGFPGRS
jgi:hypothetical protein